MKKILYFFLITLLLFALSSCYEDKGNYGYTEINDIEISGIEKDGYSAISLTHLEINPEIKTSKPGGNLSYIWAVSTNYGDTNEKDRVIPVDTIGHEKNLNYQVALDTGDYWLYLTVTNNDTGVSYYKTTRLIVTTIFSRGFYVMKEIDGNSDMDLFFTTDNAPIKNVVKGMIGNSVPGKPTNFGISFDYCFLNEGGKYEATRTLNICTENDLWVINSSNINLVYDHKSLFWGDIPQEIPIGICPGMYGVPYLSSNGVYFSYQVALFGINGAGKFGYPEEVEGGCRPSPHFTSNASRISFFDEKNGRFLAQDHNGGLHTFSDQGANGEFMPYLPNGISHKVIYFGQSRIANVGKCQVILEDATDKTQRYLYTLDVNGKYHNPILGVVKLPKLSKFNQATMYAVNETTAQVIYFVYDNMLYIYDLNTQAETLMTPAGFVSGEQITYISNRWYNETANQSDEFDYIAIGTSVNNNKYKVYLYEKLGAEVIGSPKYIFEGDGKAFGVHYVTDKMGFATKSKYSYGK